jgi:hypothetical protein
MFSDMDENMFSKEENLLDEFNNVFDVRKTKFAHIYYI